MRINKKEGFVFDGEDWSYLALVVAIILLFRNC